MFQRTLGRLCMRQALMDGMSKQEPSKDDVKKVKTLDDVLKEVLDEALSARDRGEHTDTDFVYRRTQERMYEAEHGRPPPSKGTQHLNHVPPEPRMELRRLKPWTGFDDDPWPQEHSSAFKETARFMKDAYGGGGSNDEGVAAAADAAAAGSSSTTATTPAEALSEFSDAADELGHWEAQYVSFLREHPLGLRRALPLLVEHYKLLTHRLIRAERRFLAARDRAVGTGLKLDPTDYALSEAVVERIRKIYSETHRSLSQATYDPANMNKAVSGKILKMSADDFQEWLDEKRAERNRMMCAFEEAPVVAEPEPTEQELNDREKASKAVKDATKEDDWSDEFGSRLDRLPRRSPGAAATAGGGDAPAGSAPPGLAGGPAPPAAEL